MTIYCKPNLTSSYTETKYKGEEVQKVFLVKEDIADQSAAQ